jgi:hypothetical protein
MWIDRALQRILLEAVGIAEEANVVCADGGIEWRPFFSHAAASMKRRSKDESHAFSAKIGHPAGRTATVGGAGLLRSNVDMIVLSKDGDEAAKGEGWTD